MRKLDLCLCRNKDAHKLCSNSTADQHHCFHYIGRTIPLLLNYQDPVVQSIVSLAISLRHKFVKQISAKVTNTLLFFVEKM